MSDALEDLIHELDIHNRAARPMAIRLRMNPKKAMLIAIAAGAREPSEDAKDAARWQPIETAPADKLVVVYWIDSEGSEQHDFDYKEDGCWLKHHEHHEHVTIIGGSGVSEEAPYTHWMPLPPPPAGIGQSAKEKQS